MHPSINRPLYPGWGLGIGSRHNCGQPQSLPNRHRPHNSPALQYNANMEARMKYADQPDKFLESEADLDEAVKAMLVVATAPDLYPELARRWV